MVGWSSLVVALTLLGFVPLLRAGVFDDFLAGLRVVAYGSKYNDMTLGKAVNYLITEISDFRIRALLIAIPLLGVTSRAGGIRATAAVWFIALLGVLFYAPVGPVVRPYQFHPFWLVWSINIAVIGGMILGSNLPSRWQFLSILLVLGIGAAGRPRYWCPGPLRDVITALREGRESTREPSGLSPPLRLVVRSRPLERLRRSSRLPSQQDNAQYPCRFAVDGCRHNRTGRSILGPSR